MTRADLTLAEIEPTRERDLRVVLQVAGANPAERVTVLLSLAGAVLDLQSTAYTAVGSTGDAEIDALAVDVAVWWLDIGRAAQAVAEAKRLRDASLLAYRPVRRRRQR
jgi:hypothetical protein